MTLELICLGTGTSAGVPMIACDCDVCRSPDPRDNRTRASVLIRYRQEDSDVLRQMLIDTSPEMRQQMIRHRIGRLDGVFYSHAHADHIFGLDDLRRFNAVSNGPIDLYAEPAVIEYLRSTFWYIFEPRKNVNQSFVASLAAHPIQPGEPAFHYGATWTPLRLLHGRLPILGYRVDYQGSSLAYCTDVSSIPPETYPLMQNLDLLVIDALRYRHHPTHMTVDQALGVIDQIKPKRSLLTHIAHDISHADLESRLPAGVNLAFDGLCITV
jgi:phosphoribosyl 1,2-cyclic phosphate phosphodiesterase